MAKYQNSPFGKIEGEQAGVVGSSWKGINYIRKYVVPANPQTANQQEQRNKFKNVSVFGRRIVDSVLNTYWLPKPKRKSAFNDFVGRNTKLQTSGTMDYSLIKVSFGSLYGPPPSSDFSYQGGNPINVTWDNSIQGEAQADDIAVLMCYNKTEDTFSFNTSKKRSDGSGTICSNNDDGDEVYIWLFFVDSAKTRASESNVISGTITS